MRIEYFRMVSLYSQSTSYISPAAARTEFTSSAKLILWCGFKDFTLQQSYHPIFLSRLCNPLHCYKYILQDK